MTTFAELEQKRETDGLTAAEKKQWEQLFNRDEFAFEQIFRTPVGGKVAIPNEANRRIIWQWAQGETKPITDIRVWRADIFRENPSLAHQIAWQDQQMLDPAYRGELTKQQLAADRQRFEQICKQHGLAWPNEANFNVWRNAGPDPLVSWFNNSPCIVLESGETLELIAATQEQKDEWRRQAEDKAFQQNQSKLRELAASGNITELREMAAEERVQSQKLAVSLQNQCQMLRGFVSRRECEKQPLPEYYMGKPLTVDIIKRGIGNQSSADVIRAVGKVAGFERINALIWGISDIEDFFTDADRKLREISYQLYGVAQSAH